MADKPHHGRIKGWSKSPCDSGLGFLIEGEFLDHPYIRGIGHTNAVVAFDEASGEFETRNSRYRAVTDGEPTRMHGFPWKGDTMRFLGENGYDFEREKALKVFQIGSDYEVEDCDVGDWSHSVKFVGIDGRWNGVMFQTVSMPDDVGGPRNG